MLKRNARIVVWCGVVAVSFGLACSPEETKPPGGLVLATATDLEIPKDVTHVGIQVLTANGVIRHSKWYKVGKDNRLPATLAIQPGSTDDPVTIRVFARKDREILSLSETTTTVPRDRVALLRMPIEWLSVGMVKAADDASAAGGATATGSSSVGSAAGTGGEADTSDMQFETDVAFDTVQSTCPAKQTARAGTCESAKVKSSTLPNYTPGQVFGMGSGDGDGTCFDTASCFASVKPIAITDRVKCVIDPSTTGLDLTKASLGLLTADGAGICGASGCIVPLDYIASGTIGSGWSLTPTELRLPAAVCRKLDEGTIREVVATTSCAPKVPEIPICGPWSSVNTKKVVTVTSAPILKLCWDFAESACAGIGRCRGGSGFIAGVVQDDGSCTERMRFLCDASLAMPAAESFRSYFEGCGAAFSATACDQMELLTRQACVEPTSSVKAAGESCNFGQCAPGLTCLGAVPSGVGKCVQRLAAGSPVTCGFGSAIDAVLPQGACAAGLICDSAAQRCRVPGIVGANCSADTSCVTGLVCDAGVCATAKTEGAACSDDAECGPGLHCIQTAALRQCRGPGQLGESCNVVAKELASVIWQENLCDITLGLRCDITTNKCSNSKLLESGSPCSPLNICAGGYCSGLLGGASATWVCQSYAADGAACSVTTECAPPAQCIEQQCRLRPVFGVSADSMLPIAGAASCMAGLTMCEAGCVNLMNDRNHCGNCNVACSGDAVCVNGACDCGSKQVRCGELCSNLQNDANNCGKCGTVCSAGFYCSAGICTTTCGAGLTQCGNACVNTSVDSSNCGACGSMCPTGTTCSASRCNSAGSGGATGAGGTTGTGDTTGSGGAKTTGGAASVGGAAMTATGGTTSTGGAKTTGGASSIGGTTTATGGTSTGGATNTGGSTGVAGSTSAAGSPYYCPAAPVATGGTAGTAANFSVTTEGYVTSGEWQGFASATVDALGSETSTPTLAILSPTSIGICVTGTARQSTGWARLGFNIHQTATGTIVTTSPTSAGMRIDIDNRTSAAQNVEIAGATVTSNGVDTTPRWTATIVGGSNYVPWPSFKNSAGVAYRGEPLAAVAVLVPGTANGVAFDYCVTGMGEVGSTSAELISTNGWMGGDSTTTTDDPMGIQGGFWTAGDSVAYTAPTTNPCGATGCCFQGQTIVDSTYAAWGGVLGFDLRRYASGQAAGLGSECPYRGPADCFDMVLSGTTGGSEVRFQSRSAPKLLPAGESDALTSIPAFSNGWSGRICFSQFACPSWSPHCALTNDWYNIGIWVAGGNVAGDFNLCLTSLKAVDYQ